MADRYWVGGSNPWGGGFDSTSNWSTTSGGSGGASIPTSADNVFFNAASGSGSTWIYTSAVCNNLITTGYTGTLVSQLQGYPWVYGTLTLGKSLDISPTLQSGISQTFNPGGYSITDLANGASTTIVCSGALTLTGTLFCNQSGQLTLVAGTTNVIPNLFIGAYATAEFKFRTSVSGTQASLSDSSGSNILNYIDSKDINFTGGAAWLRGTGFIDSGNNTGLSSGTASYSLFFGSIA